MNLDETTPLKMSLQTLVFLLINEPSSLWAATSVHFNSSARDSAASARSMVCSYSRRHQAFDLHVLHDPAAIPQRRVHAAPAIAGGVASITYWALAMEIGYCQVK